MLIFGFRAHAHQGNPDRPRLGFGANLGIHAEAFMRRSPSAAHPNSDLDEANLACAAERRGGPAPAVGGS